MDVHVGQAKLYGLCEAPRLERTEEARCCASDYATAYAGKVYEVVCYVPVEKI
jgi:hypothetical protein